MVHAHVEAQAFESTWAMIEVLYSDSRARDRTYISRNQHQGRLPFKEHGIAKQDVFRILDECGLGFQLLSLGTRRAAISASSTQG